MSGLPYPFLQKRLHLIDHRAANERAIVVQRRVRPHDRPIVQLAQQVAASADGARDGTGQIDEQAVANDSAGVVGQVGPPSVAVISGKRKKGPPLV